MNMREPRLMPVGETVSADVTGMLIDHLDLWTGAVTHKRSAGRGSSGKNGKVELTGIKKLRELILELAVRGKLVEQDPNDEPASVLLERIAEEKARLVKEGKIKKPKKLPEVSIDEKAFSIPSNWQWDRLERLFIVVTDGDHQAPPKAENGTPFLVISNINSGEVDFAGCRKVPENYYNELDWTRKPVNGDLLYTVTGSYGIPVMVNTNQHFCVQRHVAILKPSESTPTSYFKILLSSPYAKHYAASIATGIAQKTVPLTGLRKLPVALPPLEEQHRIVEKVDELMVLCDRLEQQVGEQLAAHETLVEVLLDALTRSRNATELAENWARVAEHFDTLFTTEASIDKLKQTILQLAVMGRLVPQEPNDEPATCFLQRYGIKSTPHSLHGWAEVALGSLGKVLGGSTPTKAKTEFWDGNIPWVSPKDMKTLLIHDSQDRITENALKQTTLKIVPAQSLLMVVRGMILAHSFPAAITGREVTINQDMKALVPPKEISAYLLLYLQAAESKIVGLVDRSSHGTCKLVSEKLWSQAIHLPPLDEQTRIVEKVGELMALCDQLKARLGEAGETRTHLAEAVVDQAVS